MGIESLIPAGIGIVSSLAKGLGGGGGGQQQAQAPPQQQQPMMPQQVPFPVNTPDGGKGPPSILDLMNLGLIRPNAQHDQGPLPGIFGPPMQQLRAPSMLDGIY